MNRKNPFILSAFRTDLCPVSSCMAAQFFSGELTLQIAHSIYYGIESLFMGLYFCRPKEAPACLHGTQELNPVYITDSYARSFQRTLNDLGFFKLVCQPLTLLVRSAKIPMLNNQYRRMNTRIRMPNQSHRRFAFFVLRRLRFFFLAVRLSAAMSVCPLLSFSLMCFSFVSIT